MPRIKIIANPIAGRGKASRVARWLEGRLKERGCEVELCFTEKAGDGRRLAEESRGGETLVCVSGDGTVNEVLNGMPSANASSLSIAPSGVSNVLAKELKLGGAPESALQRILRGESRRLDAGIDTISGRKFLLMAGAGFSAAVVRHLAENRRGTLRMYEYMTKALPVWLTYRLPRIAVEVDGRVVERKATLVEVCNVSAYGGPLKLVPEAKPNDGWLDVLIFKGVHKTDLAKFIVMCFFARFTDWRWIFAGTHVRHLRGKSIALTADGKVPLHMDGDAAGFLPAKIELLPAAVRVLV